MLKEQFNVQLPATIAFDYPTAAAVAGFIAKKGGISSNEGALEPYDLVYGALDTQLETKVHRNTHILGTGCLYPQSENISDFWQFAEKSGTAQSEIPMQRWDVDHWYDPTISKLNLSYARFAAFVSNIDQFDSAAFRMGRAEATALDPQARILLQITGDALQGSQPLDPTTTGTYVGCMFTDYMDYMRVSLQISHTGPMMTGNGAPYQSGRVAYSYGLQGPCVGIDTACSSSLVATHAAHRGIVGGEASAAIASGINALLWHETTVGICQLQALSPVGRCKSFDASADGYGRGEGFSSVYLSNSNSSGDAIGIILGGAVNQDGRSSSLTSPHGPSQQMLLATSLRYCALSPAHVENIAVHGTGTALGDPIEVGAIQAVLNDSRHLPLALTSIKSCYGHTEGAAGVTGLLFALNFTTNGVLAPIMCLRKMNPYVESAVEFSPHLNFMPRQRAAGPSGAGSTRVAGTSSFGMSGVNAHMIVQGASGSPVPLVSTAVWKLQSYWPAPLHTGFIKKISNKQYGVEAVMELNANAPSFAYLRDHTVAGRAVLPGTGILSCVGIAATYLLGEESSPLIGNTTFISPCNFGAESLRLNVALATGEVVLVSGRSSRHAASRVASSQAAAVLRSTKTIRNSSVSILLNTSQTLVKPSPVCVASIVTSDVKCSSMFAESIEPAESDATLHLSAIQATSTLLPASVAAACSRLTKNNKLSKLKDKWTCVAFLNINDATTSLTDVRLVSGGAAASLVITGLEARQATLGTTTLSSGVGGVGLNSTEYDMLYSTELQSSLPFIPEANAETDTCCFPARAREPQFSSGGASLVLNSQSLGIASVLQVMQSKSVQNISRWDLDTSLLSHAAHGVLKVASSEGIFNTRPQIVLGGRECLNTGGNLPHDINTAKIRANTVSTPILRPEQRNGPWSTPSAASTKSTKGPTLVTGALGGLGSLVSTWAALEKEPKTLLLAGRRVQSDKLLFINDISASSQNSTITVSQADVGCCEDMSMLFSEQYIGSIYHTSGSLADASISKQTLSGARAVFAPKVGALERLESNSHWMPFENVALFSSITSLLGTRGQANYAAANSVLDAAASIWEEQGKGRCASIQWGAWSGSGMAASHPSLLKRLQAQGYGSVNPQAGLKAMQAILYCLSSSVVVANPFNWAIFLKQFKEYQYLLGDLEQSADSAIEINSILATAEDHPRTSSYTSRSMSKESIASTVLGLVRGIISLENQTISLDTPFFEAGLDSIGMVELNNAVVSTFKLEKLSSTVLFDYPTINDLAAHLTTILVATTMDSAQSGEADFDLRPFGQPKISVEDIEVRLQSIMKDSFGLDLGSTTTPFSEGGLDSITSVEFQKSVQESFHLEGDFPVTAVFDFPTVELMAVEVARRLEQQSGAVLSLHGSFSQLSRQDAGVAFGKQVVVTGIASSFPTTNDQQESFMDTITNGKGTTAIIPISKWDVESLYAVEAGTANTSYCRFASVLSTQTLENFDCEIFRVTRNEAMVMDPHARLLLQHVEEAHQDSIASNARAFQRDRSTAIGVFVGCMWSNEYMEMLPQLGISQATASAITGNTFPFLAGRVAYSFGWRGPCVPTNTACSSSLVAAHVARLSMQANECQAAAVGGVNSLLSSSTTIKICALQALSPVGRCKSFDATADGYGRGEGFAVVMLEPTSSLTSENSGLAYLASTSVNTAGRSSGLTAPSGPAQRELVMDAIKAAEIAPNAVRMVAVHGTGTSLGDPIEIGALCQALDMKSAGREDNNRGAMVLASVKSCFAHTEGAAGLTGALLAIGALNAQICPSVVNLRNINPYVASSLDQAATAMLPREQAAGSIFNSGKNSSLAGK